MQFFFLFLLSLSTLLSAKPIIDLRDNNMGLEQGAIYERPDFIFMTRGKNSNVVVITDMQIGNENAIRSEGYQIVALYLMEPRAIFPQTYAYAEKNMEKFDIILTYDKILLDLDPDKCKFIHAAGYGPLKEHGLHPKSKMCSIMTGKDWTEGHVLRHRVYQKYKEYFDGYKGYDTPFAPWKDPWLNDFYFAVIIENSRTPHYFTEKLIDCLCAGTIPIYWGPPTIGEFFDMDGIITFDSVEDLGAILANLSKEEYHRRFAAVRHNFELAKLYPQHHMIREPERPDSMDVIWPYLAPYVDN